MGVKTGREISSSEEEKLIKSGQAEIYKDTVNVKIVIPKTEEAAKFYGRGTRWCTAGEKNNKFSMYNKQGPFYVIIFRGTGEKWQFHFETGQFNDEKDEELSPEQVHKVYDLFSEKMWLDAIKTGGFIIKYIKNPPEEIKLVAVKQDGNIIEYIENPSEKVQLAAVKQNGNIIEYIENPSEKVQLAAVKQNGKAIQYIKNPSEEVQLAAVEQDGYAIRHIKNPSEEIQLAAIKQNFWSIRHIKNPTEKVKQLAAQK